MAYKRVIFTFAVIVFLSVPSAARGQDLNALQASFEAYVQALNSHNSKAFVALAHDEIVLLGTLSPFPVSGRDDFRKVVEQYLTDNERVTFTAVNPQFRLAGTTGIAWGHYTLTNKSKDLPLEYSHGRYTFTYAKADGKWVLVAMHLSPLQPTYYLTF
jgi:uncharacterized protein (TIGR02246 family)